MIKELTLGNFKAFEKVNIKMRPMTFFLGPNNSGKSSILSGLRILAQTIDSFDSNVPLLLNGVLGDFGSYKDVIYNNNKTRKLNIGITLDTKSPLIRNIYDEVRLDLDFKFRTQRREIILSSSKLFVDKKLLLSTNYSVDTEKQSVSSIGIKKVPSNLKSILSGYFEFHNFIPRRYLGVRFGIPGESTQEFVDKKTEEDIRNISRVTYEFQNIFSNIEYVGAMRVPPTRTFIFTGENRAKIGANGQFATNILTIDAARRGKKSKNILENVRDWMNKSDMALDIKIEPISERHYELKIQHPETKEYENYSDVGFGLSQVLPVLIGGYNLQPRSTFIVEQPEIHLHPKAQAELGDFFLNLYERKIQSFVETHSEHLILRLQKYVLEGRISSDDIAFYYVHASKGEKQIVELTLDEDGKFKTEWPEGFFPERLKEAQEIAKLRFKKQQK